MLTRLRAASEKHLIIASFKFEKIPSKFCKSKFVAYILLEAIHTFREMIPKYLILRVVLLWCLVNITQVRAHCEQKWDDIKGPHEVAETYRIHLMKINLTDEYRSFMPSTKYQIFVKDDYGETFTRFFLTVENEDKILPAGTLELYDEQVSRFSQDCPDSIIQVSQVAKDNVSAYWTSPGEGNGCVIFRVSIMETPSKWYMDGTLEQKFCQDPKAKIDEPGPVLAECCACDEAKYELAFEGLWSRYTHPRSFPTKPWNARFSDVIGASHTNAYRFWQLDVPASDGMKLVAENGNTRLLESELKNQSEHIRTIIKARGINFPNITSKTFAVFRVDQQHHLVSVVSMIDPSPDWFLGVSGLELCLDNCSWVDQKQLNLYPIDAGTDNGLSYEASDSPTEPRDVIRRITNTWPADERSPFYDESAIDMKPMGRLYLKRQRIYEKHCDRLDVTESSEEACRVGEWGEWTNCSVTCGVGSRLRQRYFKNERSAMKHQCNVKLTDRVACWNPDSLDCPEEEPDPESCALTQWSDWTPCTKSCGREPKARDRNYRLKKKRKECRYKYPHIKLQETVDCGNPACETDGEASQGGEEEGQEGGAAAGDEQTVRTQDESDEAGSDSDDNVADATTIDKYGSENNWRVRFGEAQRPHRPLKCVDEQYSSWSFWSPCSVSCGRGTRSRSRQLLPTRWRTSETEKLLYECQYQTTTCIAATESCELDKEQQKVICSEPKEAGHCDDGHNDNSLRYYYDKTKLKCVVFHYTGCNGNMNNFRTLQECQTACNQSPLDKWKIHNYKVQLSSIVTYSAIKNNQGMGASVTNVAPRNGDIKICEESKESTNKKRKKQQRGETKSSNYGMGVDCQISEWSNWSPCYSCKGYRTMSRDILVHPRNGGKLCPTKLIRRQKCHKVMPECDTKNERALDNRSNVELSNLTRKSEVSINCQVSPWGPWSSCTASCGFSQRRRIRNILVAPRGPFGQLCPPLAEIETCVVPVC
ncbi:spondin-1-like isoform X2 [Trichogramma pretiosum]|uniref:spondin-1-like isoform X2 n=1 Tax=Trichogramma pretiosum TaxID=7493 RepID=UPI0006C97A6D|nr:spondin-1-like isoform X2 [Trichogramma pretiosum]